jgi:hypothetical protein
MPRQHVLRDKELAGQLFRSMASLNPAGADKGLVRAVVDENPDRAVPSTEG